MKKELKTEKSEKIREELYLTVIIVLTIQEWYQQRKREKSQYNNNETEKKFSFMQNEVR